MKLVRCLRLFLHGWFCNLLPFILDRTGMIHLEKVKLASQSSALCKVICSFPQKTITSIRTAQGKTLELVTSYKYLLIIDEGFGVHLQTKGEARFLLEKQAIFLLQSSKASDFWLVFSACTWSWWCCISVCFTRLPPVLDASLPLCSEVYLWR